MLKLLGEERGKVTGTDTGFPTKKMNSESKGSNGPAFAWRVNMVFIDIGEAHIRKVQTHMAALNIKEIDL